MNKERLCTTIDPDVRRSLEIFRAQKGLSGVNKAIEYIVNKYIPGGFENENNNSERESK